MSPRLVAASSAHGISVTVLAEYWFPFVHQPLILTVVRIRPVNRSLLKMLFFLVWFDRDCHPKHYLPQHSHVGKSSQRGKKKCPGRSDKWYIQFLSPRQSHGKGQSHMVFHHNGCIGRILSERGFKVQSETMVIHLCTPKL